MRRRGARVPSAGLASPVDDEPASWQSVEDDLVVATSLGRAVALRPAAWLRIVAKHRELRGRLPDVIVAIEACEHRFRDSRLSQREHFYGSQAFSRGWLRVIVDFGEDPAIIVHAMRINSLPRGLNRQ